MPAVPTRPLSAREPRLRRPTRRPSARCVKTTRDNQVAIGKDTNTYTMGGIASNASRAAQGAPTSIVTSNANGDLATHTAADLGLAYDERHCRYQLADRQSRETRRRARWRASPYRSPSRSRSSSRARTSRPASAGAISTARAPLGVSLGRRPRPRQLRAGQRPVILDGGIGYGTNEGTVAGKGGITLGW